ncbi:MAG: hypothetical protein JXA75_06005 [Candidatus Thermoplasmatota archaeon]|nr:hypothetical protein [Candidatus Thermoplasmatota archaeon]
MTDSFAEQDKEKLSRFIDLSLQMMMHGFDEMEMQKRLELVKLLGFLSEFWIEKTYGRIITLEHRVTELEQSLKKRKRL